MNSKMNVLQFNRNNLGEALTRTNIDEENNYHLDFFAKYLEGLQAKFIVIEDEYTDSDYLDDFAFFYVSCNHKYVSLCKRIHFFSSIKKIQQYQDLRNFILKMDDKDSIKILNKSYLGFIVIRPLPEVVIGRTILKPPIHNRMEYPCTRKYSVNFYGFPLEIINSLAFQQQDEAIAACATVALWSAFHKTSDLFLTQLPKASEITKNATNYYNDRRSFPSTGLSIQQMRNAIVSLGLESQIYQQTLEYLLPIIYAYLQMGIPIILDISLMKKNTEESYFYKGEHAITIVGYKCKESAGGSSATINMKNNKISLLSAHDDQVGPFSVLEILYQDSSNELFRNLQSSLDASRKGIKKIKNIGSKILSYDSSQAWIAIPNGIIVPLYDKIRVPYPRIFEYCEKFNDIIKKLHINVMNYVEPTDSDFHKQDTDGKLNYVSEQLEWNIHLITTNKLKTEIRGKFIAQPTDIDNNIRNDFERVMLRSHPKYIWRVKLTLTIQNSFKEDILDIFADASDTPHAFPMYEMIWYSSLFRNLYKNVLDRSPIYLNDSISTPEYLFLTKYLN
jgi:hypothetical protein